uniref:Uncharacterized protein n=1 Tax=Steinernema glaseri TaxID=37863 RepID=A0A1I8AH61_9BILA
MKLVPYEYQHTCRKCTLLDESKKIINDIMHVLNVKTPPDVKMQQHQNLLHKLMLWRQKERQEAEKPIPVRIEQFDNRFTEPSASEAFVHSENLGDVTGMEVDNAMTDENPPLPTNVQQMTEYLTAYMNRQKRKKRQVTFKTPVYKRKKRV